jgi:bla regulator protein BlaR1
LKSRQIKVDRTAAQPQLPGSQSNALGPECQGSRFIATATMLTRVIYWAYDIQGPNLSGWPAWAQYGSRDAWYDIEARAAKPLDVAQCREMARALLADRFQLVVRRETRELPVYALLVGKNGPKIREVSDPSDSAHAGAINGVRISPDTGKAEPWSMQTLAKALNLTAMRAANRQVVDHTGLPGVYEFNLVYDEFADLPSGPHNLPEMGAAVEEQLGLKLEPRKEPVETWVVVRLEKPTEN